MNWLRRLFAAEGGSIMVMAAFALTAVMGMSGLAVEIGSGYSAKVRNQRVADMAALGAALAYKINKSEASARQVAKDIVIANGLPEGDATVTVPTTVNGSQAVTVEIDTAVPIKIASVLTSKASYNVHSMSAASIPANTASGCIVALGNSGNTVSADGGAKILADGCAITTNGTVYSANTSATVTAKQITAATINDPSASWGGHGIITTPTSSNWTTKNNAASDSLKDSNAAVKDALCMINKLNATSDSDYADGNTSCTSPLVAPTSTGSATGQPDVTFTSGSSPPGAYASYYNSSTATYTLPGNSYTFGNVTVNGGVTVKFTAATVSLKANSFTMNGKDLTFANGDITIVNNLNINADNAVTMGNGSHSFGSLTIGGGKKLNVGTGNFNLVGGVSVSGGAYLKVNIAADNTVIIGKDGSGNSIAVGGGSKVCFTSDCTMASAAAGTFSATGNVNVQGGGSLIVFPKTATHVIGGDLIATAGVLFGSGTYYIGGSFTNTTGSGSDSMNGTDVSFVLGGVFNFAGGSHFDLAAPSAANSAYGIQDMLFVTKSSAATQISAGATGKASGMIYAPNSAFSSSGGSSISANGSACMMLVVKSIAVTGSGTVTTSSCSSQSSSSSAAVALIQ